MTEIVINLDDSFTDSVCNYVAGLLKFEKGHQEAVPAGTGTFAKVGKVGGIITAAHVLKHLPNSEVGLVRFQTVEPKLQNLRINMQHTDNVMMWDEVEGHSPDIAFLRIPDTDVTRIEAQGAVFYNFDRQREFKPSKLEHRMATSHAIVGVVGEWAEEASVGGTKGKKKIVGALFGAARVTKEFNEDGTDLLEIEIDYSSSNRVPESYEGVSGSALWELHSELDGIKIIKVSKRLVGVAFRQSKDSGRHVIICHSRVEVSKLIQLVREKWPETVVQQA